MRVLLPSEMWLEAEGVSLRVSTPEMCGLRSVHSSVSGARKHVEKLPPKINISKPLAKLGLEESVEASP